MESCRAPGPLALAAIALACVGCGGGGTKTSEPTVVEGPCALPAEGGDFTQKIGCRKDFDALASIPLDASIPGARSVKVVLDRLSGDALYFQNSTKYQVHYQFAAAHLSGMGKPIVPMLSTFNRSEYYTPDRRFVLGAVTYYEGGKVWALEMAPYDTASAEMITRLYQEIQKAAFFGPALVFHPTSQAAELEAKNLTKAVRVMSTAQLFASIDYQPLNLGNAMGRLRFVRSADLAAAYAGFRDIVVLDQTPNDISVVSGIISEEFQTPLSHVNVLAQQRKTPNMGLRKAWTNAELRALDGKWIELVVGAFAYSVKEVTVAEADAFWEMKKPKPVVLPTLNNEATALLDIEQVVVEGAVPLKEAMQTAIRAYGAKAAGYSVLAKTDGVPWRKAFAIPVRYYTQFMQQNGFYAQVDALLADPDFRDKPEVRDAKLAALRDAIKVAPVDPAFQELLRAKLNTDFPGETMRFRTSTNAEDLDGFPCAGCYDSHTGDPRDWEGSLLAAIRKTWATVWFYRTFEERSYHSIDHKGVGMALLVHHNFPAEEANGVAITANPFDPSGLEPGFYVNVQFGGEAEVVHPPPGVTSDEFIYHYTFQGQPIVYLSRSNLVPDGTTVLSAAQVYELGMALDAIHRRFAVAFGPPPGQTGWYAMDVEFKFDGEPGEVPKLFVKQARPFPGRGQ